MIGKNIKNIAKYLALSQYGFRKPEIFFNLTYKCPLRCKYCYIDYNQSKDFTYEDVGYIIKNGILKNGHIKLITFFGGEPALKIDIIEKILNEFHSNFDSNGIHIAIITSFSVNCERIINLVKKYPYFEVVISFDEYGNDRIFGNGKIFKVLDNTNLNILKEYKKNICFHTVINDEGSIKNLSLLFDIYKNYGIYYSWCWNKTPYIVCSDEMIQKYNIIIQKIIDDGKYYPQQLLSEVRSFIKKDNNGCGIGSELFLSANGEISPCSISNSTNELKLMKNGLINDDIPEKIDILTNDIFNNDKCHNCSIKGFCNGGCLFERYKNRNSYNIPNDILCINMRKLYDMYSLFSNDILKKVYDIAVSQELGHLEYCYDNSVNIDMDDYFSRG